MQMEAPGGNYRGSSEMGNGNSRRYGMQISASNIIQAPLSALLEYSGLLRVRSSHQEMESLINGTGFLDRVEESAPGGNSGEVSIRIIGAGEQENERVGTGLASLAVGPVRDNEATVQQIAGQGSGTVTFEGHGQSQGESRAGDGISPSRNGNGDEEVADGPGASGRDSSYQRYDMQQAAKWIEQVLPFTLLLLVVFIRQHLQGTIVYYVNVQIHVSNYKFVPLSKPITSVRFFDFLNCLVCVDFLGLSICTSTTFLYAFITSYCHYSYLHTSYHNSTRHHSSYHHSILFILVVSIIVISGPFSFCF